ncbi:MAG TPA: hypothetical protein VHV08_11900, partial [Pirellulales bacterium]|nr:hypothetical protein [Pirellulales bacterium]
MGEFVNEGYATTLFRRVPRAVTATIVVGWVSFVIEAQHVAAAENAVGVSWPATDALARKLPVEGEVKAPRANRSVGIFYFLWLADWQNRSPQGNGPYDVSRILAADPDALSKPESSLWGPFGMPHYWGQSIYGYYRSDDPWVLRRHANLLADAGIDTLIFDTTNAETYAATYTKLCDVFTQIRREGDTTPRIAFMVNTKAGETAQKLYQHLYAPGRYRELWYTWLDKPLLICDPQAASSEVRDFFTLRRAHWPFQLINTPSAWHWEATYPQPFGYAEQADAAEQVTVSVAQNLRAADGLVTNMSRLDARGRSFHDKKQDATPGAVLHGYNFHEQWQRAFELDPPFVLVTGWNEWIAGRFSQPNEPIAFVDQFSQEFSRDIEPMQGGHGDNYYYQLVANVRRYKGVAALAKATAPK